MEDKYVAAANGIELQTTDAELIAEVAALADDRLLAEILRITPYGGTVLKAVLPFAHLGAQGGIVEGNGASGQVKLNPFRAVVGPRTAAGTDAKKAWRDIRSVVYVGGATSLTGTANIAANASGNARIDLVYATVAVDANGASVTRYAKDPSTKVVTSSSVVRSKVTSVTIGVVTGTPGASPAVPATPADGGSSYVIPLAYVRVPNGFGAASTVAVQDILHVSPIVPLARSLGGGRSVRPANQNHKAEGSVLTAARIATWANGGTRPAYNVPSECVGSETLLVALDLADASSANWSHPGNGTVIDDSRDWTSFYFKWTAFVRATTGVKFAGDKTAVLADPLLPQYLTVIGTNAQVVPGFGQSLFKDLTATVADASAAVALNNTNCTEITAVGTPVVYVYVDHADSGKLKLHATANPLVKIWLVLEAFGPFPNY
jgi:hypothetical protein